MHPTAPYPVRAQARFDPALGRWSWPITWLVAIPHYLVLVLLWAGFWIATLIAFFAILITARYPRPLFTFNLGVLRWSWRVGCYSCGALGTDRYPPFTLADEPGYPAHLHIDYPGQLSRGLALVKWWLLALPHYLVPALFLGGGLVVVRVSDTGLSPGGMIGLFVLVAALALLCTGRYPPRVYDLVLGMGRWTLRVMAYVTLMTDAYPPFRLDRGGIDPADGAPAGSAPAATIPIAVPPAGVTGMVEVSPHPVGVPADRRRPVVGEPLPWWVMVLLGLGATAVLGVAVWSSAHLRVDPELRTAALFVHLAALVVGFGAVIAVDWFALLWLLGRRSLNDLMSVASAAHLPIWLGLAGLVLTGALCRPDLALPLTWIKLGLVLLVMLNGLYAYAVGERLVRVVPGTVPPGLLRNAAMIAAVSQFGWWGAVLIGFVNAQ